MKIKSIMIFSFTLIALLSQTAFSEEDDYVPSDADIQTEETYIPEESVTTADEPILLDESDSTTVDGAQDYDY